MKKPILYDLVALAFPRVSRALAAQGHETAKHLTYDLGYQQGYDRGKRDIVRSMMANLDGEYSISAHVDGDGYGWYDVTIQKPEEHEA